MKAVGCLITLCLLAGFIGAEQYAWQVGKSYTYEASGRLLAGISEINTQYAGMEIKYTVELVPIGPNRLILKPTNIKVWEVNEEQDGGWRDVPELKGQTQVELPEKIREFLESPVEVKFNKGVVESIKVQGDLPNYAVNIKKAQVSHFILDSAGQNAVMSGNMNRENPNHVRPQDPSTQTGMFYETMEETVLGECETYYTMSESGPYENPRTDPLKVDLARESSHDQSGESQESQKGSREDKQSSSDESSEEYKHSKYMAYKDMARRSGSSEETGALAPEVFHNFCEGKHRLMEFTKTVNYSMCHNKPALGYASPSFIVDGRAGDNSFGSALARVSYSRYIACGQDRKQLTILKIEQEEQIFQGILRKEKTIGGSVQNLTLIHILPTSRTPVGPSQPKEFTDLTYTFSAKEQKMRRDGQLRTAFEADEKDSDQSESDQDKSSSEEGDQKRPRRAAEYYGSYSERMEEPKEHNEYAVQWASKDSEGKQQLKKPSMVQPPLNPWLASPLNRESMIVRVGVLLDEIVSDVTDEKPMAEEETVSKIATISKVLRYLAYADVDILYNRHANKQQTDGDKIRRKIFLDCVAMAGTNPNIKLIIDRIAEKRIVGEEATQLVMTFSMYIRTPTAELIKYFHDKLVDFSPRPENMDQLHTTAVLAFTNLLYDACVNTRIANTRYPVQIYGEFCSPMVVAQYLPGLVKKLESALEKVNEDEHSVGAAHWVTVFLTALGNTGHPSIVKEVQKILDTVSDSYIKAKAVSALKRLVLSRSNQNVPIGEQMAVDRKSRDILTDEIVEKKVLPVLVSVAFDKTEAQEVRMIAISLLSHATPTDVTLWQQLAYSTWFELNQEVHSYIYNLIWSLSHLSRPADPVTWRAHQRARAVLPLVKPIELGLSRSRSWRESDFYDEIQSGFMQHYSQFGSENSIYPNSIYYQNFKFFGSGASAESPVEFSANGHTIYHILSYLAGKFTRPTQSQVEGNDAIKMIADLLHIVDREQDETPQASFRIKLRSEIERIFSINREVVDQFIELLKKEYFPALITGIPINYQKTMKLSEGNYEYPTIFGIPVQTVSETQNLISIRGNIKVEGHQGLKHVQVNMELHPILSYKTHGHISFKSPFSGKAYRAGVQLHSVFEFPVRAMFTRTPAGAIEFAVTPTHLTEGTVAGQIDIFTFHRRPYTAIISDECWPTSHKEGGQMKIVHALDTPFKQVDQFGQKALGLAFKWEQETEFQPEREELSGWTRFAQKFRGSWGGWFHNGLSGAKTLRLAERKLTLDVSESKSKTILLIAAGQCRSGVGHVVSEVSSEENLIQDSKESDGSSSSEETSTGAYRQIYDSRSGDYQSYMDKQIKQRQYSEYHNYKYARHQKSEEKDSSEESSEEHEGELKYYPGNYQNYRASYEESNEQNKQAGQEPTRQTRWFVVALLGKTSPLHPPMKIRGMQNPKENAPSAVQYLLSAHHQSGQVEVRLSAGESTKEHASELPENSAAVEVIKKAIQSPLTRDQQPYCGDYEGTYEFPTWANRDSLLFLRENLLRQELKVKVAGELSFGASCRNKIHNVTFKGELKRDEEMTKYAKEESFEAKKCIEDEKKGFASSPVCITNSEQQAAALNVAQFEFRATPLPSNIINATLQLRELAKAYFYQYMTYDPMPIRPMSQRVIDNYLKVSVKLDPQFQFITLKFFRPTEQFFFENIRLNRFAKAILPLTATQTLKENIRDRVFKTAVSCSIEGTFVNSFDNVTYEFDSAAATNCKHVLVQDCSGKKAVSVLAGNLGGSKLITTVLLPGNFRIELIPSIRTNEGLQGTYVTATSNEIIVPGQGRVLVNGSPVEKLPTVVHDKKGHFIARIEEGAGASLQLYADDIAVISDGRHIVVYPSNQLRNNTCGLCGNFDVSKTIDFRSPRDCPLSSGTLMMAAYAFQQPWTKNINAVPVCKISEDIKKKVEREERDCKASEFGPLRAYADCKDELVQKIGDAVYKIVKTALKPIPFVNGEKWASKARDKVRELLKGKTNADQIADIIASGIAGFIPYVGAVVKPLIKYAVKKIVEVVCAQSGCCDTVWYF